jgi:hypothetical protein
MNGGLTYYRYVFVNIVRGHIRVTTPVLDPDSLILRIQGFDVQK